MTWKTSEWSSFMTIKEIYSAKNNVTALCYFNSHPHLHFFLQVDQPCDCDLVDIEPVDGHLLPQDLRNLLKYGIYNIGVLSPSGLTLITDGKYQNFRFKSQEDGPYMIGPYLKPSQLVFDKVEFPQGFKQMENLFNYYGLAPEMKLAKTIFLPPDNKLVPLMETFTRIDNYSAVRCFLLNHLAEVVIMPQTQKTQITTMANNNIPLQISEYSSTIQKIPILSYQQPYFCIERPLEVSLTEPSILVFSIGSLHEICNSMVILFKQFLDQRLVLIGEELLVLNKAIQDFLKMKKNSKALHNLSPIITTHGSVSQLVKQFIKQLQLC